ncbi:MAG: hypothetical protein HQ450_02780 [Alcaligenaceae bacterium]|nr:hypothetical protein [Alcaligenaceae bacterium]
MNEANEHLRCPWLFSHSVLDFLLESSSMKRASPFIAFPLLSQPTIALLFENS